MPLSSWTTVGTIVKPHGTKGGFVTALHVTPVLFGELEKVWVCYPGQDRVPYRIAESRPTPSGGSRLLFFVRLEGIDNRDISERLRGKELLSDESVPVEVKGPDTTGYTVFRQDDSLMGIIEDSILTAGASVYVVKAGDKQILIPDVVVYVDRICHETNRIFVKNTSELEEL